MSKTVFRSNDPTVDNGWTNGGAARGTTILNKIERFRERSKSNTSEDIIPTRAKLYRLTTLLSANEIYIQLFDRIKSGYTLTRGEVRMIEDHYREMTLSRKL